MNLDGGSVCQEGAAGIRSRIHLIDVQIAGEAVGIFISGHRLQLGKGCVALRHIIEKELVGAVFACIGHFACPLIGFGPGIEKYAGSQDDGQGQKACGAKKPEGGEAGRIFCGTLV